MLKSLFSGVSGLQSHQIAMDVESNNIANVNTVGYKYSRANFSDLLAQTNQIATAPQGQLGGKNAVQIGLGASVASITRIHTQGSIQNTDKNTDLAIQGDGFFVVSSDAGSTYKYTRSGDFKFDANGNFVDNNGFIAQGRLRDPITGNIESDSSIQNILIPPGLTTPAQATSEVVLKANLNSGPVVQNFSKAYAVNSGIPVDSANPALDVNGVPIASGNLNVLTNEVGQGFGIQTGQGVWVGFQAATTDSTVIPVGPTSPAADLVFDVNFSLDDPLAAPVNINVVIPAQVAGSESTQAANLQTVIDAINAETSVTGVQASASVITPGAITLTNDNSDPDASHNINMTVGATDTIGIFGVPTTVVSDIEAYQYIYDATVNDSTGSLDAYVWDPAAPAVPGPGLGAYIGDLEKRFGTLAQLRQAMESQVAVDQLGLGAVAGAPNSTHISINDKGEIEVSNKDNAPAINLKVTGFKSSSVTENIFFTRSMEVLNTSLAANAPSTSTTQAFNAPTHSTAIDVFDSLGTKWTLRAEFRKSELTLDNGSTWQMHITVPQPAEINDGSANALPLNDLYGEISFDEFGAISSPPTPSSILFSGNNGSEPNQRIDFEFGSSGQFDGMTSFDSISSTSGINQDGFTGGDILGIRIDQSGTLIGSFSNGRSFGLAQMTMAKFANNEGLLADGGNIYLQSSNSGEPILGEAASGGRGFIQAAALEASNVDLSRSLTQLIIIQRGYQANGKTITTSDQLLETLIGLKR